MITTRDKLPRPPTAPSIWLTAAEVAAELGCHVETVYAMARAGSLPGARRHGTRSWRFHREELETYKRGRPAAEPEVGPEEPVVALWAAGGIDGGSLADLPLVLGDLTASDLERLGLLLLGYARLLQRHERRPKAERR